MRTKNAAPSLQAEEAVAATDQEIAACPFCGSPGRIYHDAQNGVFSVDCSRSWTENDREDCCSMALVKSLPEAIAVWNSRADASTIATLRAALARYGRHDGNCGVSVCAECAPWPVEICDCPAGAPTLPCSCGLSAALDDKEG